MKKFKNTHLIFVASVILAFAVVCMCGCSKNKIESAKFLGYDGKSFNETMNDYVKHMTTEEVKKASCDWKEGWIGDDAPDSSVLTKNEKAMTYIISIDLVYDGDTESNRIIFYMVHDTQDNVLSVQSGVFEEDGEKYPMALSEAREMLTSVFDEYN